MDSSLSSLAALAAEASIVRPDTASALVAAANLLLADLERGRAVDAQALRAAMVAAFGGSDAEGAWTWKTAYEACEAAQVLFLRKFGAAMRKRGAAACLPMLAKIAALLPSHTRRSEESQALQQFSTPSALVMLRQQPRRWCPAISCLSLRRAQACSPFLPSLRVLASF
jgi:hypothetical protein